jgi:lysophospholipase L1-like esterase
MVRTNRFVDYLVAALLAVLVFMVSPVGLMLTKGHAGLTTREITMTLALDAFLISWIGAIVAQGRCRRFFFHLVVWTFPLLLFDGLETLARSTHMAERIMPVTDESGLVNKSRLPAYFSDETRWMATSPGWRVYKPWNSGGVFVNDLGLRTAAPTPKAADEWRVAISGGSTVWGWRVLDADTIPVILQRLVQHAPRKITVYNFGIEGATLEAELLTLQRFRETYALDQVLFYTGSNDVLKSYSTATGGRRKFEEFVASPFELGKAAKAVSAVIHGVDASDRARFENEIMRPVMQDNPLRRSVIAAERYCRDTELECSVALQPTLVTRRNHPGGEARIARTYDLLVPGMAMLTNEMYRDAIAAVTDGRIYDLTDVFDDQPRPFFTDHVHLTEDGNRVVAAALAPLLLKNVPLTVLDQQRPTSRSVTR